MKEFTPPISEREEGELIDIAHSYSSTWQSEAILQAKHELANRRISLKKQKEILELWDLNDKLRIKEYEKQLELNKTKSYKFWEMLVIFIFGPIIIMIPQLRRKGLSYLKSENYILKFKQRIILFILSIFAWFIYADYSWKQQEEKRMGEVEKVDISEWEKEFGYDN